MPNDGRFAAYLLNYRERVYSVCTVLVTLLRMTQIMQRVGVQ